MKEEKILRPLEEKPNVTKKNSVAVILVYMLLIGLGIGTGYMLSVKPSTGSMENGKGGSLGGIDQETVKKGDINSSCPTGELQSGGLGSEGTHKLIRPGGPSQTAYLTSSVLDLDEYVGKTVRVCGQTMAAEKAPWLMDVEKIDVQ